jgi:hypothetical protein
MRPGKSLERRGFIVIKQATATVPLVSKHDQKARLTWSKVKSIELPAIFIKYARTMEIAQMLSAK